VSKNRAAAGAAAEQARFRALPARRSLEHVVSEIRRAIVNGSLAPGQRLPTETELASQLGVSRPALREALKALELSGYLEVRRGYGGGTFVIEPQAEEFTVIPAPALPRLSVTQEELRDVRFAVEPVAARRAVRAKMEQLAAMQACNAALRRSGQPARVLAAVVQFHLLVATAACNQVFVSLLEALRPLMYRALNEPAQDARWRRACLRDHETICDLLAAGDGEGAEGAMREHLRREMGDA
jgi:GntR family transcriptional repressor for pyruvate dehydrogenase complex